MRKGFLEIVGDEYEIDEICGPAWPEKEVTVELDQDPDTGKLSIIKRQIPRPDYVLCRSLKKRIQS